MTLCRASSSVTVANRRLHSKPPGQGSMSVIAIYSQLTLGWCPLSISMTVHWIRAVKITLRFIGLALFTFALLFAAGLWYSTAHGYMTWWFSSGGKVAVDGARSGFLHVNRAHSAAIVTRTDLRPTQSYLVSLSGKKFVIHCGDWQAPRYPAFFIGDVNPPCSVFTNGSDRSTADNAVLSTLRACPGLVEFQTERGKKVTVSW